MKLWRISYHDDDSPSGNVTEWFPNKPAAEKRLREIEREYEGTSVGFFVQDDDAPVRVTIPAETRAGLAEWLTGYEP